MLSELQTNISCSTSHLFSWIHLCVCCGCLYHCEWMHTACMYACCVQETRGRILENKGEILKQIFSIPIINIKTHSVFSFNIFLTIGLIFCILSVLLYICVITGIYFLFICWTSSLGWPIRAETCRRFITRCLLFCLITVQFWYIYIYTHTHIYVCVCVCVCVWWLWIIV